MEFSVPTILYQSVLFVALYFVLKQLVFDPFLANLDARRHRTRGALEEANKLRSEAERLRTEYDEQMAAVRREAAAARDEIRRMADKEEAALIEAARIEAAQTLAAARQRIAAEAEAARATLAAETARLSAEVVEQLLGRRS